MAVGILCAVLVVLYGVKEVLAVPLGRRWMVSSLSTWLLIDRPDSRAQQSAIATDDVLNPYPDKPRIAFRADGTFKLTVFSDLHYGKRRSGKLKDHCHLQRIGCAFGAP